MLFGGKSMRKRITSLLLALCMALTLTPRATLAAEPKSEAQARTGTQDRRGISYRVMGGNIYFDPARGAITGSDKSVTAADIPATIGGVAVTSIGGFAFSECRSLANVLISDTIESIGAYAFNKCVALTTIAIPSSVTFIADGAFDGCINLKSILTNNRNGFYTSIDGVLFDKNQTELVCYPGGNPKENYVIPNSVTTIKYGAFAWCDDLTSLTIPNSVTTIEYGAFAWCNGLVSVKIPSSVTSIADSAFIGCDNLTSVTIATGATTIGTDFSLGVAI